MALLFIDGFDHYATADLAKKWSGSSGSVGISATNGRRGGGALQCYYGATGYVFKALPASYSTLIAGVAMAMSSLPGGGVTTYLAFQDAGVLQVSLRINNDLTISAMRGTSSGTVLGTSTLALTLNVYYYVEMRATIHPTAGAVEVRLNSAVALSLTGENTRNTANSSANAVMLGPASGVSADPTFYADDFYCADTSGAINNNFLGDCRVDTLYPNADGAYSGLTPSTGSAHWSTVDDVTPNTSDYVSSATVNAKDSYAFTDLTAATTVYGVQISNACLKDDAGARSVANLVRSGGTDAQGATVALTTGLQYVSSVHELNPATGTAWTQSTVNAAEFGTVVAA